MTLESAQGFFTRWSLTLTEPGVSMRTLSQPMKCTSVTLHGKKPSSILTKTTLSMAIIIFIVNVIKLSTVIYHHLFKSMPL